MHNVNAANQALPLETYGGLVTLVRPENIPEGASPRCYDVDFLVGSVETRPGLQNVVSFQNSTVGPDGCAVAANVPVTGNAWTNPANIIANNAKFTTIYPYMGSDALALSGFSFNLAAGSNPTGIAVVLRGFATSVVTVAAQLTVNGLPVGAPKTVVLPRALGTVTLGGPRDMWGSGLSYGLINSVTFGVTITASAPDFALGQALLQYAAISVSAATIGANFNFFTSFVAQDSTVSNLYLDSAGNFWVEDVANSAGTLKLVFGGVQPNSFASGVNGPDVEYLAFNDLNAGCDIPRQYTKQWTDRISQVGPGAAPIFSASSASAVTYAISTITQPIAHAYNYSYFMQSQGPGNSTAGNVCTIYYADSTLGGPDADLVKAFNSGNAVYIAFSFTGGPVVQGPYTVVVTSVGEGAPPGQPRQFYYFTFQLQTNVYTYYQGSGNYSYTANYQQSLATMTMSVPVPQLIVGNAAVVSGSSVPAWNSTWPITQTLNSGSMAITQTSITGGVGTYSYSVVSGAAPTVGQLVTITNTLNGNGALNGVNLSIAGVAGTNIGTFTISNLAAVVNYPTQAESGQASTAGVQFTFEPGLATLGSATSPIYGNGTGGLISVTGSGQFVSAGTKQGVCFFITRNGAYTAPSPPVTFTIPQNTTSINYSFLPIGPPNVIARAIGFTESGANGVPGGNFFTIPTPVQYAVQGQKYTVSSLFINDNTTTSGTLFLTDTVLLNATAIDIHGNNLFNLIEIGNPGWMVNYDNRNFYGLCQNKINNFLNMSFDGGYLPGSQLEPLGWTQSDSFGQLLVSPIFGNSYYIQNTSANSQGYIGLVSQGAYQDVYLQPILSANTAYSVRVTARIPSGNTFGSLCVDLQQLGITYGILTIPFSQLSTTMQTVTGTLLVNKFLTVPSGLQIRVYGSGLGSGADVEIDRVDVFPTAIPVLGTSLFASYVGLPEAVDAVTGRVIFAGENQQPINGAVVMYDSLYVLKGSSMYSLQASGSLEPSQWNVTAVAQKAGACGINAYDFGEQWIVEACRNGLYMFDGGQPGKIMQEIYQVWDAINWAAGNSIWVRNDVTGRRLLVGVPLPTPNFWLPNAPVNAAPTSPNVILMLNYQGCDTGGEIKTEMMLHTTMFGSLNATDMKRKWSIWQIASPYVASVSKSAVDTELRFGNGSNSSKVYNLLHTSGVPMDDGLVINSLYTTYAFPNVSKAAQMPLLGMFRKLFTYLTHQVSGSGVLNVKLLPNTLLGPTDSTVGYHPWTIPNGFVLTDPCAQIREAPLNFAATRMFVEFSTVGRMNISNLIVMARKHVMNQLTGQR